LDIEELSDLIQQHGKALYGFCRRLTGNQADADDLYQETFLKAIEARNKLDRNRNPKSFLISIAVQLRNNHRRKFAWRQRIAPTSDFEESKDVPGSSGQEETPEDAVLSLERRRSLQAAADSLQDKLKIPLYMHYTAEMSIEEIASALRIPLGTVKSRLYKARQAMKKDLEVELP